MCRVWVRIIIAHSHLCTPVAVTLGSAVRTGTNIKSFFTSTDEDHKFLSGDTANDCRVGSSTEETPITETPPSTQATQSQKGDTAKDRRGWSQYQDNSHHRDTSQCQGNPFMNKQALPAPLTYSVHIHHTGSRLKTTTNEGDTAKSNCCEWSA